MTTTAQTIRAYVLLGELLDTPDMPALAWTIHPDGDALTGEAVEGDSVRRSDAFHAWADRLGAVRNPARRWRDVYRLSGTAVRDGIQIVLAAALHES